MKTRILTVFAGLLFLSPLNFQLSTLFAQGSLTPPGPPAPTMKTLDQIEPRTPISSAPFTITVPGSYYLATNLTVSSGNGITIATNGVTLDLNGFTIASTKPDASSGFGIRIINGRLRNVAILNGFIQGGVTNDGSGVYSGSGFNGGLYGNLVQNVRVSGVSVSGCLDFGIVLGTGESTVVESCTVRTVGGVGILASTIKASVAKDCGGSAIYGDQVADCRGESTGSGYGLYATTALNCVGISISSYGLYASTAQNCSGTSSSGITGLYGNMALNCYGFNSNSGYGLYGDHTAQNCVGESDSGSGLGLYAAIAQNCYGQNSSGTGLSSAVAQNCYGNSGGSGTGLNAGDIAIGCGGYSYSGTGLSARIANSCRGTTTIGTAQSITFKYNMP